MTCKIAGLAAVLVMVAGPVSAHAFLKTAAPAVGSTVSAAPDSVALDFTEGVEPRFCTVTVTNAAGVRVDLDAVHLAPGGNTRLIAGVKPLPAGQYAVTWHATSVDTHKTEGRFTFTVKP